MVNQELLLETRLTMEQLGLSLSITILLSLLLELRDLIFQFRHAIDTLIQLALEIEQCHLPELHQLVRSSTRALSHLGLMDLKFTVQALKYKLLSALSCKSFY